MIDFFPELQPVAKESDGAKSVLIIEDDIDVRDILTHSLEHQGFETTEADTGHEGIEVARKECPRIILLDLNLPDIPGIEVLEDLADDPTLESSAFIVISGLESPDLVRQTRRAGGSFFLRKPFDPNALLILIEHLLGELDSDIADPDEPETGLDDSPW